jgi:hypothetical protein
VAGNLAWRCHQAAVQLEDPGGDSRGILFANNTGFDSSVCFRLWHNSPDERPVRGQAAFYNNLFIEARESDLNAVAEGGPKAGAPRPGGAAVPQSANAAVALWGFANNRRDYSGLRPLGRFPLAPGDNRLIDKPRFVSRDPKDPGFMCPAPREKWALEGAGQLDPTLPRYVGAVPPRGVEPWDWNITWRARMRKDLPASKDRAGKRAPAGK